MRVATLAGAGGLLGAGPALAADSGPTLQTADCMQRVFIGNNTNPVTNSNRLNCTANDIQLSRATSVSPSTCTEGDFFTLTATFETIVTANARYDAGFFFRTDGGDNARGDGNEATGVCSVSALTPGIDPSLDLDTDEGGDLNAGTYSLTFTIEDVFCQGDDEGFLKLPNCTSWHSNQGTVCDPVDSEFEFHPDTKSKCVCDDDFTVPVTVVPASIDVTKSASPSQVPETGDTVTYTVQITNPGNDPVTILSIDDNLYGNLRNPSNQLVTNNTCDDLAEEIAAGATVNCTFQAFVSGDAGATVTDTVEVCVVEDGACDDDFADVSITDVPAAPSLTKTASSTSCQMQVDATFDVLVRNNSAIDSMDLQALNDDQFGNIATPGTLGPNVISTTCSVTQTIAPGGSYPCSFVGRITSNVCTFTHTDTVTGKVEDDDRIISFPNDSASVTVTTTRQ